MSNSQDDIDDDGASSIYCPSAGNVIELHNSNIIFSHDVLDTECQRVKD